MHISNDTVKYNNISLLIFFQRFVTFYKRTDRSDSQFSFLQGTPTNSSFYVFDHFHFQHSWVSLDTNKPNIQLTQMCLEMVWMHSDNNYSFISTRKLLVSNGSPNQVSDVIFIESYQLNWRNCAYKLRVENTGERNKYMARINVSASGVRNLIQQPFANLKAILRS